MKRLRKAIGVFVCVVAVSLMLVGPTQAGVSCRVISATAQGQDLGNGSTVANVKDGGLLQGTTTGNFTFTNFSFPVATFAGPIQFTTNRGTLTMSRYRDR